MHKRNHSIQELYYEQTKAFPSAPGERAEHLNLAFGLTCSGHSSPVNSDLKAHTPCWFYSGHISLCMGFRHKLVPLCGRTLPHLLGESPDESGLGNTALALLPSSHQRHALGPGLLQNHLPPEPPPACSITQL